MDKFQLPIVSFIIPTYHAEKTLKRCLENIFAQDYPKDRFEVIIIDGGSSDKTVNIAKKYPVRILFNKKRNPDGRKGGRAIGINAARGELITLVDDDIFLASNRWLKTMVQPFLEDSEVVICETPVFINKNDPLINKYCILIARAEGDVFTFLFHVVDDKWLPKNQKDFGDFMIYTAEKIKPPLLANGAMARKNVIQKLGGFDYDTDLALRMINNGYDKAAKAKTAGVFHLYVENFHAFVRKGINRYRFFLNYISQGKRKMALDFWLPSDQHTRLNLIRRCISTIALVGPLIYAVRKLKEDNDPAWLYHPVASMAVLIICLIVFLTNRKGISLLKSMFTV
jgi:glycosyltransferase involved in cell wall biosynthesis